MPRPNSLPLAATAITLNRGNARQRVFHKEADYPAFARLLDEAHARWPLRVPASISGK